MSAYLINWDDLSADSRKWYKQQTADVQKVVDDCIRLIAMSPYGERPTYKHLKAEFYCNWRYREGDFRIIYSIVKASRVLRIQRMGPRHNVYK